MKKFIFQKLLVPFFNKLPATLLSNQTLKIRLGNKFYKFRINEMGNMLVNNEFENFNLLKLKSFDDYVPKVELKKIKGFNYLKMESLNSFECNNICLRSIYEHFNLKAEVKEVNQHIIPQLLAKFELQEIKLLLEKISKLELTKNIGLIHGDFHSGNVMKNNCGEIKLIDMDLSQPNWDRHFDLINIFVSDQILKFGLTWNEAFKLSWKNHGKLEAVEIKWPDLAEIEKKCAFYFYYLTRLLNECEIVDTAQHEKMVQFLEMESLLK